MTNMPLLRIKHNKASMDYTFYCIFLIYGYNWKTKPSVFILLNKSNMGKKMIITFFFPNITKH